MNKNIDVDSTVDLFVGLPVVNLIDF